MDESMAAEIAKIEAELEADRQLREYQQQQQQFGFGSAAASANEQSVPTDGTTTNPAAVNPFLTHFASQSPQPPPTQPPQQQQLQPQQQQQQQSLPAGAMGPFTMRGYAPVGNPFTAGGGAGADGGKPAANPFGGPGQPMGGFGSVVGAGPSMGSAAASAVPPPTQHTFSKDTDGRSIFVGNLPKGDNGGPTTTAEELVQFFSDCGPILNCTVLRDRTTQEPKGMAYIEFAAYTGMGKAIDTKNNATFKGHTINVTKKRSTFKPGRARGRGRGGGLPDATQAIMALMGMAAGFNMMRGGRGAGGRGRGAGGRGSGGGAAGPAAPGPFGQGPAAPPGATGGFQPFQ